MSNGNWPLDSSEANYLGNNGDTTDNLEEFSSHQSGTVIDDLRKVRQIPMVTSSDPQKPIQVPVRLPWQGLDEVSDATYDLFPDVQERGNQGIVSGSWEASHLADGQASSVYAARAVLAWQFDKLEEAKQSQQPFTFKVARKQLHNNTSLEQFILEFEALTLTRDYNHPNIIQVLHAFRLEENKVQSFNLLFPLALGNFKQLFRGNLNNVIQAHHSLELWGQFEGLANALEYLHGKCQIAHRDIKASNILIYHDEGSGLLQAKLADFGLAMNLKGAISWTLGTVEMKSAWNYSAPEIRRLGAEANIDAESILTPYDILKGDIWKLGAVFVELLTFLLLQSSGQRRFRKFITKTVDNMTSDTITEYHHLEDGEKVKPEVLIWLSKLASMDPMAAELEPILIKMLADAPERPYAKKVSEEMAILSSCLYTDGCRTMRFLRPEYIPKRSIIDHCKEIIEKTLKSEVNWWPLPQGTQLCKPTNQRIVWRWYDKWLTIDAPLDIVTDFRDKCCRPVSHPPSYTPDPPLPTHSSALHSNGPTSTQWTSASGGNAPHLQPYAFHPAGNRSSFSGHGSPTAIHTAAVSRQELYWCVDASWSDPPRTSVSSIRLDDVRTDTTLFRKLRAEYDRRRGILGRYFSWKSCGGVEFINFAISKMGNQSIARIAEGIPHNPPVTGYDYHKPPTRSDIIHMRIAGKEIAEGIIDPPNVGGLHTLPDIPKRTQRFAWARGDDGWGIRAIQAWSLKKVMGWFGGAVLIGWIFVVLWLAKVGKTDLQNAFVPMTFLISVIMVLLGVPALLNIA